MTNAWKIKEAIKQDIDSMTILPEYRITILSIHGMLAC